MSNINALRQKRAGVLKDARALNDKATASGRDLTAAEARQFESKMDEFENLGKQIDRGEALERETLRLAELTNEQVDWNSEPTAPQTRTSFTDAASGREFRCYGSKEPIADVRNESALDFAKVIVERCTGQRLLTPERRAAQVDSDVSGGYLVNANSAFGVFEMARSKMGVALAGARTLPIVGTDSVNLALVTGDPTYSWARELQQYDQDDSTAFSTMKLQANKCITQVEASYEFMRTANGPQVLLDLLTNALAAEIDRVALTGDPGASGGACPTGLVNTSGILTAAATGGTISWDQLLDVLGALQAANVDPTAMIVTPGVNTFMAKIKDGEGQYMTPPGDLANLKKVVTSKMTSQQAIMGSFEDLLLCPFGQMEINTTKDVAGRRGSFLIEVVSYFDVGVIWPGHFHALTGITY